ncbi:hypothetical protein HanIR_Chr09g0419991 [Helianthus annuus]|nr:hypothetical protein HanIR_Chr09g0419991 [Helianthus annuus]
MKVQGLILPKNKHLRQKGWLAPPRLAPLQGSRPARTFVPADSFSARELGSFCVFSCVSCI